MNRIRNAYIQVHPELEPHFMTSPYDDLPGALQTLGIDIKGSSALGSIGHGLVTLPGMLSMIVAAVGGAIGALAAIGIGLPPLGVLLIGAAAFLVVAVLLGMSGRRAVTRLSPTLEPRFPSPKT